ncbi:unnamed protein product [Peronospora destructor]|uniref:Uncharacterized protein n=1 Tax=Peronospora destructor TaxID=86335 RepID=A0AAV0UMJ5_9STRA|nr:unnamed protein product [Peronospora destructor]
MDCYDPVNSRALNVLLGFEHKIRAFLNSFDQQNLWVYAETQTGRRKRKYSPSLRQVHVLLRDLLPVASGLRPSCLVDCCALTKELVELLLDSLTSENESSQQWFDPIHIRAVLLDGNFFFVNVEAFVREKMVELATGRNEHMYVDVSASLSLPRLICSTSETGLERLKVFADWIVSACRNLLTSTYSRVLEWKRPSTLNATALAGILLCYPYVYDIFEDNSITKKGDWSEQKNCLAMCPLYLFQIKALIPTEQMEIAVQEFSVPQHLLDNDLENEAKIHPVSLLVNFLRAHCKLKLRRAIELSCLALTNAQPQVRVDSRMLHRVAL